MNHRHPRSEGKTLRDIALITNTGVFVVAVARDGETLPTPMADFRLAAGDTAVVVGTPEGIASAFELLRRA